MGAIASDGFRELERAMGEAMAQGGGRQGFKGIAIAYVRFAQANPALYHVMFGPEVANTADLPELAQAGRSCLGFVQAGLEQLQNAGLVIRGMRGHAVACWAALHGIVSLIRDGRRRPGRGHRALVDVTLTSLCFGSPAQGTAEPLRPSPPERRLGAVPALRPGHAHPGRAFVGGR